MGRSTRHELYGIAATIDGAHVACVESRTDLWVDPDDLASAIQMVEERLGGRHQKVMPAASGRRLAIVQDDR